MTAAQKSQLTKQINAVNDLYNSLYSEIINQHPQANGYIYIYMEK